MGDDLTSPDPLVASSELANLVRAVQARLEWMARRGVHAVSARPSPRQGATEHPATEHPATDLLGTDVEPMPDAATIDEAEVAQLAARTEARAESAEDPLHRLAQIRREIGPCTGCRLAETRKNIVFGVGAPEAEIMFIGEAPGRDEDLQGEPFVGIAGQLLTKMIEAMGLTRDEVYIANIIKCRPPQNRDPAPDEVDACEPFLRRQIAAIGPRIIIAMGNFAAKTLLRTDLGITRLRGRFHTYQGVPLMPTFHPAYLLRNADAKRPAWQDLKTVMAEMDRLGLRRRRAP